MAAGLEGGPVMYRRPPAMGYVCTAHPSSATPSCPTCRAATHVAKATDCPTCKRAQSDNVYEAWVASVERGAADELRAARVTFAAVLVAALVCIGVALARCDERRGYFMVRIAPPVDAAPAVEVGP